jgi:hypothetical protein
LQKGWLKKYLKVPANGSATPRHAEQDPFTGLSEIWFAVENLWARNRIKVGCAIYIIAFVNALIFVVLVSDPLLTQDAWYFLDVFVRHAYDGKLGIGDFFVRRAGLDHAQPLRKLILLMELKWFRLSLLPQAVIGFLCAGVCAYLLYRLIQREEGSSGQRIQAPLMCLTIGCILISLNSTAIWSWSLVTLGYTSLVFVFWFFIAVWRASTTGRYAGLAASSALLAIVADDSAMLAGAAAVLAVIGFGLKKGLREGWWRVPLIFVAIIAIEQILVGVFGPVIGGNKSSAHVSHLVRVFLDGGWWRWPVFALSDSVVSNETLHRVVPRHVFLWQVGLAGILAGLHLWFWWRFLRIRSTGPVFVAVCLMLLYYAFVAGIVYGRVGTYGSTYLHEPRYVLLYQLNLVALALMYAGGRQHRMDSLPRRLWVRLQPGAALALCLLALQPVFANAAWHKAPYIRLYHRKEARQIMAMAQHPETTPKACAPELPICGMTPKKRAELLDLLQRNNLNVFNATFRRIHSLQP